MVGNILNLFLLSLLMCKLATGVAIAYDVTCTGCGTGMLHSEAPDGFTSNVAFHFRPSFHHLLTGIGGYYTMQQTSPTAGVASRNPNIICSIGDTVTFNFPVALSGYAVNLYTDCEWNENENWKFY